MTGKPKHTHMDTVTPLLDALRNIAEHRRVCHEYDADCDHGGKDCNWIAPAKGDTTDD